MLSAPWDIEPSFEYNHQIAQMAEQTGFSVAASASRSRMS